MVWVAHFHKLALSRNVLPYQSSHGWLTHPTPHPTTPCTVTSSFPSPPHLTLPPFRLTCLPIHTCIYKRHSETRFLFSLQTCPLRLDMHLQYNTLLYTVQHTLQPSLAFCHTSTSLLLISTQPPLSSPFFPFPPPSPPLLLWYVHSWHCCTPSHGKWEGEGVYRTVNTVIVCCQYLQYMYSWCALQL